MGFLNAYDQGLCEYFHRNRVSALDFDGDKRHHWRAPSQRTFERRLNDATGDRRWEVRRARDGTWCAGIEYKRQRFTPFFCGRTGLFHQGLVQFAQISHYGFAERMLAMIEAQEAAREAEDDRVRREMLEDTADLAYKYGDDANVKHFPMLSRLKGAPVSAGAMAA